MAVCPLLFPSVDQSRQPGQSTWNIITVSVCVCVCDKHRKTTIVDLACAIMFPLTYYYRPDAVTLPVPAKHSSTCQRQGCWRPRPITRARHPGNGHTLKGPNESHNHRYPSDSIRGQGKNQGKEMIGEVRKGVAWDIPLFPLAVLPAAQSHRLVSSSLTCRASLAFLPLGHAVSRDLLLHT